MKTLNKTALDLLRAKRPEVSEVISVGPDDTVLSALGLMRDKNIGAVIVLEHGELKGILTERDYARDVELEGKTASACLVREIMTERRIVFAKPADSLERCHALMKAHRIRHLPICEDRKVIGVLSARDILEAIITGEEHLIRELETDRLMMTTDTGFY
ncbi:CBS domain-containing protein [Bosea sp. BIWAKO-01]|uniref:CBS domain-containing protein n=1 Tax=Bosea sp. BIWAKO-01 TaxID=506668 RepID=UPI000853EF38|nr:CBS domain-containing protein [Bosea sp. BIWAKO-01]GAU86019.1 inosine-5'-monophosphate dehydrogenase [Bosea sp. BIWAKO-01]